MHVLGGVEGSQIVITVYLLEKQTDKAFSKVEKESLFKNDPDSSCP